MSAILFRFMQTCNVIVYQQNKEITISLQAVLVLPCVGYDSQNYMELVYRRKAEWGWDLELMTIRAVAKEC